MASTEETGVKLQVTGLPYKFIGAAFNFSYNSIPTASLSIDPSTANVCDPDSLKRKPVSVTLSTKYGCVNFDGLFDGISCQQSVGSFGYTAIIKSKFQSLLETYPNCPGLSPFSSLPIARINPLDVQYGETIGKINALRIGATSVEAGGKNIISYFLEVLAAGLQAQLELQPVDFGGVIAPSIYQKLTENGTYKQSIINSIEFIKNIDTSAIDDMIVPASSLQYAGGFDELFSEFESTVFDTLVDRLTKLGCWLIIGSNKAWIVPAGSFIQLDSPTPGQGQHATAANTVYPADFVSFNFNDNGYVDIGSCYVVGTKSSILSTNFPRGELGYFAEPGGAEKSAGIFVAQLPTWIDGVWEEAVAKGRKNLIAANKLDFNGKADTEKDKLVQDYKSQTTESNEALISDDLQKYFNAYAQSRYFQQKYRDRTGSINTILKTNICPGTACVLYSRYPGHFLDGVVASVSHSVEITPNGGSASSSISFSHGRLGKGLGVDTDELYGYSRSKMTAVQEGFVSDIGA